MKTIAKLLVSIIFLLGAGSASVAAYDLGNYQVLVPSIIGNQSEVVSFEEWAGLFFKTALGLIAGLAVIQLAYGGIEYVLSASLGGKTDGRDRIVQALQGLGIALFAYLILKIINPDLVFFPDFFK